MSTKTRRYYYTPTRMTKIQNTDNIECWKRCGVTETHSLLLGMQNGVTTLEDILALSSGLPYNPEISLLDIYT